MPRISRTALALIVVAGTTLAAQDKPEFAGEWALERSTGASQQIAIGMSVSYDVEKGVRVLVVERRFDTGRRSDRYLIGVVSGTVSGTVGRGLNREQTRTAVRWDGESLVINSGRYSGPARDSGPYTERHEIWSLDQQGKLSIVTTESGSDFETRKGTATYTRR